MLRKVERRCGKQKAADESRKSVEETQKAVEEIGYFTTYLIYPAIFMVHADADDDDADDTDGFKIIEMYKPIGPTAQKSVQGHLLYHL